MKYTVSFDRRIKTWLWALCLSLTVTGVSVAEQADMGASNAEVSSSMNLPFLFYNELFGLSAGYIYGASGFPQKQSAVFGTAMAGTTGSAMVILLGTDIRLFGQPRLTADLAMSVGYFGEIVSYVESNPDFSGERAGSHGSDVDNNIKGKGWENSLRFRFSYLLPIGYGKKHNSKNYKFERGLLTSGASGGQSWNPFASGKTFIRVAPFFRMVTVESDDLEDTDVRTNGADFEFLWDNRDYPLNPDRGNSLRFEISRDFGAFKSTGSWTAYQFEFDKYFSLGSNGWLRQSTLAFDFWIANSPTWKLSAANEVMNGAPAFAGASLGGYWKLRGYPSARFSDKAAILYAVELRLTPKWNLFDSFGWLQRKLNVQWVQFAPFVELGRVAPRSDFDQLNTDMKWNAGLGIRFFAKGLIIRIDTAATDEGFNVQMMLGQPFQF